MWAPGSGWKKKVDHLRSFILSVAELKELPTEVRKTFDLFAMYEKGFLNDKEAEAEFERLELKGTLSPLTWEPLDIYGWHINTTLYLCDGKIWWLVRATLKNETHLPNEKDRLSLEKVVDYLGADTKRDLMIDLVKKTETAAASIYWTWINQHQMMEMQGNPELLKRYKDKRGLRIVHRGAPETDGFVRFMFDDGTERYRKPEDDAEDAAVSERDTNYGRGILLDAVKTAAKN